MSVMIVSVIVTFFCWLLTNTNTKTKYKYIFVKSGLQNCPGALTEMLDAIECTYLLLFYSRLLHTISGRRQKEIDHPFDSELCKHCTVM